MRRHAATLGLLFLAGACAGPQARWDGTSARGEAAALQGALVDAEREWRFARQAAKFAAAEEGDWRRAVTHLAVLEDLRGNHAYAHRLYAQAQRPETPLLANVYAPLAAKLVQMAMQYRAKGRSLDAARLYQRAFMVVTLPVITPGHDGPLILRPFPTLYADPMDFEAAADAYRRTVAAQEARLGPMHPDLGWTLTALGDLEAAQGRLAEAEAHYARALAAREHGMGPGDVETIQSLSTLQTFYAAIGRLDDAEVMAQRVRAAWDLRQPCTRPPTVGDWHIWARMAELQQADDDARAHYTRMYDTFGAAPAHVTRHPAMRTLLNDYARFLRRTGDRAAAAAVAAKARAVPYVSP